MGARQPTSIPVRCARTALASASLCLIQRWFCRLQWGITTLPHDTDGEVLCAPMTESRPDRATYYNGPVRHGMSRAPHAFNPGPVSEAIQQFVHARSRQVTLLAQEDMGITRDVGAVAVDEPMEQVTGLLAHPNFPLLASLAVDNQVCFVQGDMHPVQRQVR